MAHALAALISESARRFPDRVAVRDGERDTTYRELDEASDRFAAALQEHGVARGDRVGIWVHKSTASVVGIFAVLKAGGCYVPLDPNAPPARLAWVLGDCGVRVLFSARDMAGGIEALRKEGATLDAVLHAEERPASGVPAPTATVESDLAYILYTSGSTGDPKGVMISHRACLTFVDWAVATFALGPEDRVTSHAPIHFDLSTFDVFATIATGATIVVVPETCGVFPVQLVELLQRERITVTYLVPSVMSLMRAYGNLAAHDLSAIRCLLFAGEVCPIDCLRDWAAALPRAELYNLYGPTETNVCTYYRVRPEDVAPEATRPVPIGKACENTEVFAVTDDGERLLEPGRRGELWVRGPGLAHGYWADPEKTEERFVPNRFRPEAREIAYRTGDYVYFDRPGGDWLYAGRRDHMVKSRGHRIELGEIETVLSSHPGVAEAVVVAVPDELLGNRIRAYWVAAAGAAPEASELDRVCRKRLPEYMVPERIEVVDALPRTSTGKIDRRSLAERGAR